MTPNESTDQDAIARLISPKPIPLPTALWGALAPATHYVYEWSEYWLSWPEADRLRIGSDWQFPTPLGGFRLRFENQVGLTSIQPYRKGRPLAPALSVEVLTPKFPSPEAHVDFLRALLDDLFTRAARLPFHFAGPTSRGVAESLRPPSPLFVYHFLLHYGPRLRQALETVRAHPHRLLVDYPTYLPLVLASEAGPDVLVDIIHGPERWTRASGFPLADRLQGYAPTQVWQRLSAETLDTPENRFVLAFLGQAFTAAETLPAQSWWRNVPDDRRRKITELTALLGRTLAWPLFREVGVMERVPLSSQVLLRQEGYRDLRDLYWRFHQARRPLFAPLRKSMELRDIATLYEQWCFFALTEEIGTQLDITPRIELRTTVEHGLKWKATAYFRNLGKLVYNRGWRSYSVPLRPDFTWIRNGRRDVVLDAKFRLRRVDVDISQDSPPPATAQLTDLYKMHTYRDALKVRAAVSIYPGDENVFFDRVTKQRRQDVSIADVLIGDVSGIGAFALVPS